MGRVPLLWVVWAELGEQEDAGELEQAAEGGCLERVPDGYLSSARIRNTEKVHKFDP